MWQEPLIRILQITAECIEMLTIALSALQCCRGSSRRYFGSGEPHVAGLRQEVRLLAGVKARLHRAPPRQQLVHRVRVLPVRVQQSGALLLGTLHGKLGSAQQTHDNV